MLLPSFVRRWLNGKAFAPRRARPATTRPDGRRTRPRLEALEDRSVPSTLAVTSSGDDVNEQGTLRYDIAHAQSGDTILLTGAVKSGIVLTHGELVLNQNVTIRTADDHHIMISGGGQSRVFEVAAGTHVTLANLAITDGNGVADNPDGSSQYDGSGGGILNFGALTIDDSTLSGNSARLSSLGFGGGGILNFGALTIDDSTLSGNSAAFTAGGSIENAGTLTVSASTLSGNSAGSGGGIFNFGALAVNDSTLSGNFAFEGGGIFNESGWTLTVSGSTLSSNSATFGGGIDNGGTLTVSASTLSGNSAADEGGGIYNFSGTLTANDSTVCGNNAPLGADLYLAGGVLINNNSTICVIFP
jgi:hypothetical protein